MNQSNITARIKSAPRTAWIITAVVLVLFIIGISLLLSNVSSQAKNAAATFNRDVQTYTQKLSATNRSINAVKPIVPTAPKLKSVTFGGINSEYKVAQAKQAALTVYQTEVFQPAAAYNTKSTAYTDLLNASKEYGSSINSSTVDAFETESKPVFTSYRDSAKKIAENNLSATDAYIVSINKIDFGQNGANYKRYALAQANSIKKTNSDMLKAVNSATNIAEVRAAYDLARFKNLQISNNFNYSLFAHNAAVYKPFFVTSPAVDSITKTMKSIADGDESKAVKQAYTSLYYSIAAYNVPTTKDDDLSAGRKIGTAAYALDRLQYVSSMKGSELNGGDAKSIQQTTSKAQAVLSELPSNTAYDKAPSGLYRFKYIFDELAVDTSSLDGFKSLVDNVDATKRDSGATTNFASFDTFSRELKAYYPSQYFGNEVKQFDGVVIPYVNEIVAFHKKAEPILKKQRDLYDKIDPYYKELSSISKTDNPSQKDQDKLNDLRGKIRSSNDELARLEAQQKSLTDSENQKLDEMAKRVAPVLQSIDAKAKNLEAHYTFVYDEMNKLAM